MVRPTPTMTATARISRVSWRRPPDASPCRPAFRTGSRRGPPSAFRFPPERSSFFPPIRRCAPKARVCPPRRSCPNMDPDTLSSKDRSPVLMDSKRFSNLRAMKRPAVEDRSPAEPVGSVPRDDRFGSLLKEPSIPKAAIEVLKNADGPLTPARVTEIVSAGRKEWASYSSGNIGNGRTNPRFEPPCLKKHPPFHSEVQHPMWVNGGRIDA